MLIGLGYVLYATSFIYTEVVRVIVLFYLMPVWGFLVARVFIGEPITPVRWFSMAAGVAGMLVIFDIDTGVPLPRNAGDWMALTAGILWAFASLMLLVDKQTLSRDYCFMLFFWGTILSIVFAAFAASQGVLGEPHWGALGDVAAWLLPFAIVVLIPAGLATVFGPSHLNPGIVGLLFMTEISVAVVTAALLAGEPFGWREIIGIALITLAGLAEPLRGLLMRSRGTHELTS